MGIPRMDRKNPQSNHQPTSCNFIDLWYSPYRGFNSTPSSLAGLLVQNPSINGWFRNTPISGNLHMFFYSASNSWGKIDLYRILQWYIDLPNHQKQHWSINGYIYIIYTYGFYILVIWSDCCGYQWYIPHIWLGSKFHGDLGLLRQVRRARAKVLDRLDRRTMT